MCTSALCTHWCPSTVSGCENYPHLLINKDREGPNVRNVVGKWEPRQFDENAGRGYPLTQKALQGLTRCWGSHSIVQLGRWTLRAVLG
eukprot:5217154-Amphidinium_carterae.1